MEKSERDKLRSFYRLGGLDDCWDLLKNGKLAELLDYVEQLEKERANNKTCEKCYQELPLVTAQAPSPQDWPSDEESVDAAKKHGRYDDEAYSAWMACYRWLKERMGVK